VIDNFDPFYPEAIKLRNVERHAANPRLTLVRADIRSLPEIKMVAPAKIDVIVHCAARAGVRPSILDPLTYQEVNVQGTQNMLEFAREAGVRQFVFASSSSVYGINPRAPWSEDDHVLNPISPYAATKVSGELLGHVYSALYGMRFLSLRFFTVYGPRQRPDLAIHKFAELMMDAKPIPVFGDGRMRRDYTYIADIVAGVRAAMEYDGSKYEVINLGNGRPLSVLDMIRTLEEITGMEARIEWRAEQPGDVPHTSANIHKARRLLGYDPQTEFQNGVRDFWQWKRSSGSRLGLALAGGGQA
jgi:UDP-glucuronate 4-epimerase